MDKVQKHSSFNTNTASSESYRNYCLGRCNRAPHSFEIRAAVSLPQNIEASFLFTGGSSPLNASTSVDTNMADVASSKDIVLSPPVIPA
jgi:hypothetical protein